MEFSFTTKKEEGRTFIDAVGSINAVIAKDLEAGLEKIYDGSTDLIIDFTNVKYISSAGLRLLVVAHKKMKAKGGKLTIKNVKKEVFEVFEMTGLSAVLNFIND